MHSLTNELRQLKENNQDVALLLDVFGEIERVYRDALEAMGALSKYTSQVRDSADVTVSFHHTSSTDGS